VPISLRVIGIVEDKWTVELEWEGELEEFKSFLVRNPKLMWLLDKMLPQEVQLEEEKEVESPSPEKKTETETQKEA